MLTVTLYTRKDCSLCEEAKADLAALQEAHPHRLVEIDIDSDPVLQKKYALEIPVVETGPFVLKAPITRQQLQATLGAARDRQSALENLEDPAYKLAVKQGQTITSSDRISYWISKHYLLVINLFLLLYVGLPFLAPVLMKSGANLPAKIIYKVYSPLCHQWAFRSWFLFGEQAIYPRAAAGVQGVQTFETVTGLNDLTDPAHMKARAFEGTPTLGYKVAICERDVAIWGALLLFGVLYGATGKRIKGLHWALWIILGILPPALDGGSQLISQLNLPFLQAILPFRETTPLLRSLTGFMFGFMTGWFGFPAIEEAMADTRRLLAKKFATLKHPL
jgi:uncharacterized membrane protein